MDKAGIDPAGKSWDQVLAEVAAHSAAKRLSEDELGRVFEQGLQGLRPDLDYERAVVSEMRGRLMEGDISIASEFRDGNDQAVMMSARNAMEEADHEFMAWDTAFDCLKKV